MAGAIGCGTNTTYSDMSQPPPADLSVVPSPDLAQLPPDLLPGPDLAQLPLPSTTWERSPRWKLTWRDEFNGMPAGLTPERQLCYTKTPRCTYHINGYVEDCRLADQHPGLDGLDNCTWTVYAGDNFWASGYDNFRSDMVTLKDGELIIDVQKSAGSGPWDCGNPMVNNWEFTDVCPLKAGGITSKQYVDQWVNIGHVDQEGFGQYYGRFEVRGKLSFGPAAYPAYWMLPQTGGWPSGGEIDIMEHDESSEHTEYWATIHGTSGNYHFWESNSYHPNLSIAPNVETLTQDYHVYAVEWDHDEIRFYLDNMYMGASKNNTHTNPIWEPRQCTTTLFNNGIPFYWILFDTAKPDLNNLASYWHSPTKIDYVRTYQPCPAPAAGAAYPPECVENTLKESCANPCDGIGRFDGWSCLVRRPDTSAGPPEMYIDGNHFYYRYGNFTGPGLCSPGDIYVSFQKGCDAGEIPAGRTGSIGTDGFYLSPICSTTSEMANCPKLCELGTFDGVDECRIANVPAGASAFVYNNNFYYSKVTTGANPCPYAVAGYTVTYDNANCHVDIPVPTGTTAKIDKSWFATNSSCAYTPDWQRSRTRGRFRAHASGGRRRSRRRRGSPCGEAGRSTRRRRA
jgi:hypothetical protein